MPTSPDMVIPAPFRVLLIEDCPDDRADLRQMLLRGSPRHYTFTEAETGTAGLRAVLDPQATPPDCVLLDYNLPDMDALEVIAALHAGGELTVCPVVVVTGSLERGTLTLRAGAQEFLGKSWATPESATRAIDSAVERHVASRGRLAAEAALRLTAERLTLAVKCSQVVLFQQDLDLRYIWLKNPATGFEDSAAIGKRDADLMERAADAAVTEALKREVLRSGVARRQEVRVQTAGVDRHYDLLVEPLRDPAGLITGVTCAAIDITRRKLGEEALRARTDELQTLLDTLPGFVWIARDAECRLIVGNRTANEFVGVDQGANVSQSVAATGAAPYLRQLKEDGTEYQVEELPLQRALATGLPVRDAVLDFHFSDGRRAQVVGDAVPLFDDQGRIRGGLAVFVDITERKRAEAARHETERNYRALAAASSEIAYRMSADWSTMLPLDGRQLVASSDQPLNDWAWLDQNIPPDEHSRVRQAISEAIARKTLFELEHRVRRPDGSIGWTLSRAVPILDENECVIAWFGAASDITDRKQAEEALAEAHGQLASRAQQLESLVQQRTAKLTEAMGELEGFAYSITHDLRAPLRAVNSFAQMLAEDYGAKLGDDGNRLLGRIQQSVTRMDNLIQDVLHYSKVLRMDLKLGPVDAERLVRGMLETYPDLQEPKATIVIEGGFPAVLANQAALTQCFSNLLNNAVKFVPAGIKPHVTVRAVEAESKVRFWVEDNGIGIPPKYQESIFGMFQRLTNDYEGTGVGLSIVRKAAERMGGAVGVESAPGQGSRFWIELNSVNTKSQKP